MQLDDAIAQELGVCGDLALQLCLQLVRSASRLQAKIKLAFVIIGLLVRQRQGRKLTTQNPGLRHVAPLTIVTSQ